MSEAVEQLKAIGVEKIHQQTHIPLSFLQAMINHKFEKLSKVQFLGFVAILEREYKLDLDELREAGIAYFTEHEVVKSVDENNLFVTPKPIRNFAPLYIGFALIIFIVAIAVSLQFSPTSKETQNISLLKSMQISHKVLQEEHNISIDEGNTTLNTLEETTQELPKKSQEKKQVVPEKQLIEEKQEKKPTKEQQKVHSFVIQPKVKVWLGYIDMKNYKHYQKTFSSPLALDPSKEWLLTFGHGLVSFEIDGEKQKFSSTKGLKFHYKDGVLEQLTPQEFKRFNRGRAW